MKKTSKILIIFTIIMCNIFAFEFLFFEKTVYAMNYNNSTSEIIMDVCSNRVLYSKNASEKKYMASTTKILTAITIIENCNLSDIVEVTKQSIGVEGSSIYLEEGEKLSVKELLFGLMLRSGNDCAETLALYCSKSIKNFADLMNETAKKIGAKSSNFVNPHGLHDDNHYTTAYDLALISCYAMKNKDFREIVGTQKVKIPFSTQNTVRLLINKNKMLSSFVGATGIKTGFTKKAGRCLVSSVVRNGMELVSVVLNSPNMFERSKELLTNAFNEYEVKKIVDCNNVIDFIDIDKSSNKCPIYIKNDIILPISKDEENDIKINYNYEKKLDFGTAKDTNIGQIEIYIKNNLIFIEKIYTMLLAK